MGSRVNLLTLTDHHLFPASQLLRRRRHRIKLKDNRVPIWLGLHQAWHYLFHNATPEESLQEIVWYWLPPAEVIQVDFRTQLRPGILRPLFQQHLGHRRKVQAFQLVFPTQRPLEILKLWIWQWVPRDYVSELSVRIGQVDRFIQPDAPDVGLIAKIKRRQLCKLKELQAA